MRNLFIISLLLVGCALALGQSSAEILNETVTYTISEDGAVEKQVVQRVKLHDFTAFSRFGEWFYTYNPELEEVRIVRSVTIQPDGTEVPTPENGILDQSPYATANAPDFSFMRERMVSHVGLEPGSIIEFEFVIADRHPFRTVIFEPMGDYFPVLEKTVVFQGKVPSKVTRHGLAEKTGKNTYGVRNLPAMILADEFAAVTDMPFVYAELRNPLSVARELFADEANQEGISALAGRLKLNGFHTPAEAVAAVTDMVNHRLVTVNLPAEKTGYSLRKADEIYQSGYATPLEKAFLATTLLNTFRVDHQMLVLADGVGESVLLHEPRWAVLADYPVYPEDLSVTGERVVTLAGNAFPAPAESHCHLSLHLKETEKNTFSGDAVLSLRNPLGNMDPHRLLPLEGAKLEKPKIRIHSLAQRTVTGQVTYTLKDGRLEMSSSALEYLRLPRLLAALPGHTHITLPCQLKMSIHVTLDFIADRIITCAADSAVANEAGRCEWTVRRGERSLDFAGSLDIVKTGYATADAAELQALLAPFLSANGQVILVE
ncbi:MAG: DUF3857 domain-containing protein [Acidobacteria bacterium]|nr:DUF3857 domain-containing protein [Acidobacteriota bacterium]